MHRILVGVAVVAVVLAIGAVVLVALGYMDNKSADTPKPTETAEVSEEQALIITEESVAEAPGPVARPKAKPKPKPEAPEKTDVAAALATAAADESPQDKANRILANLNDDEQRALMRAMGRRRMEQRRDRRRYELPSDRRLRSLERTRDEALRLSDAQREQIEALKDVMKPQIEAAMQEIWAKQEELRERASQLMEEGKREEARAVWQEFGPLREQANEIQAPLDEQYKTSLAGILSPEQVEVLERAPEPSSGDRRGMRFGGQDGRGGGGGRR